VKPAGGSETVLIVEDEEPLRILIRRILVRAGYKALTAANGEEALRVCEHLEGRFDLLLTDVIMPGMSGRELAERLTAIQPHVRVVYMSGYSGDSIRQQGMLDPGLPYVEKPFLAGELIAEIRRVLDTKPVAGPAGTPGPRHTGER
jgi:two-component system, cell cycle sensor histidine kinase and response regulator CckA